LRSADAVGPGSRLDIEFVDGRVGATAEGDRSPQPLAKAKVRGRSGDEGAGGQGTLFGS
jgi:exodeoxyribonuclease VII large subunit